MKTEIIILLGSIAGFVISLPKGPAGFAIINQTIVHGWRQGLAIASSCILTTFLSSLIVLFPKFAFIKNFTVSVGVFVQKFPWIGALILITLGIYLLFFLRQKKNGPLQGWKLFLEWLALFSFTIIDPIVYTQAISIFTSLTENETTKISIFDQAIALRILFFIGVMIGTFFYYGVSSWIIHKYLNRSWFPSIQKINKTTGILFIIFGVILLLL